MLPCLRLGQSIDDALPELRLGAEERANLSQFRRCLSLRSDQLSASTGAILDSIDANRPQRPASPSSVSLDDMKKIARTLDELFTSSVSAFPLTLPSSALPLQPAAGSRENVISVATEDRAASDNQADHSGSNLLPPPSLPAGCTAISLQLHCIGVKDAAVYVNPHIVVSLASSSGSVVEQQKTGFLSLSPSQPQHLDIGCVVHLQSSLQAVETGRLRLYLSLCHWKNDKRKVSVRCWAMMESAEWREAASREAVVLELYQKPVDWTRKRRLNLFTEKKLYLSLSATMTEH